MEQSRLTQARGLKQLDHEPVRLEAVVAPHAGAWIETQRPAVSDHDPAQSRLTQARGLKLAARVDNDDKE